MSRDEFVDFLARAVRDQLITETQAIELIRQFDDGTLDLDNLPLGLDAGDEDERDAVVAVIPWLISFGVVSGSIQSRALAEQLVLLDLALRSMPESTKILIREALREEFKTEAARLAGIAAGGDVARWQKRMADLIRRNSIEQRIIGSSRLLGAGEIAQVEASIERQLAFLSRFADQIALARASGKPLSEEYIANRSTLYGGNGYAEFFRGEGAEFLETTSDLSNWVYYYVSVDDDSTCGPCLAAEAAGPYGSDDPFIPYPGDICLGGARCRCSLIAVYDPAAAIEASSRAAA